jgi:hypothetical protein
MRLPPLFLQDFAFAARRIDPLLMIRHGQAAPAL